MASNETYMETRTKLQNSLTFKFSYFRAVAIYLQHWFKIKQISSLTVFDAIFTEDEIQVGNADVHITEAEGNVLEPDATCYLKGRGDGAVYIGSLGFRV